MTTTIMDRLKELQAAYDRKQELIKRLRDEQDKIDLEMTRVDQEERK